MKKGKQIFTMVLALLLIITIVLPTKVQAIAKPKLSATKITLEVGETKKLVVENTKNKIKWTSENKEVATVNSNGTVKAMDKGITQIKAYDKETKRTYTCKVTVEKQKIVLYCPMEEKGYNLSVPFSSYKIASLRQYLKSMDIMISEDAKWGSGDETILFRKGNAFLGLAYGTTTLKIISDGKTYNLDVELTKEPSYILTENDMIINRPDGTKWNILEDKEGLDSTFYGYRTQIAYYYGEPNSLQKSSRGIQLGSTLKEVYNAFGYILYYPHDSDSRNLTFWNTPEHTAKFRLIGREIFLKEYNVTVSMTFMFDQNDTLMDITYDIINPKK